MCVCVCVCVEVVEQEAEFSESAQLRATCCLSYKAVLPLAPRMLGKCCVHLHFPASGSLRNPFHSTVTTLVLVFSSLSVYLAKPGLSCSTWDLPSLLRHAGSQSRHVDLVP